MLVPDPSKREAVGDLAWFHSVVRRVFLHRRKVLRSVLSSLYRDRWTKPEIDTLLESLGLDGGIRAEAMNVDEFISLAEALRSRSEPEGPEPDEE
jgi:16S rRNA (adenine1518-N6/adenine1519-N6)-dimethyltransferase